MSECMRLLPRVLPMLLAGCVGAIDGSDGPPLDDAPEIIERVPAELCDERLQAAPLRRLTSEELEHTLEDLFGDALGPNTRMAFATFPRESVGGGDLATFQPRQVEAHVQAMFNVAYAAAEELLAGGFSALGFLVHGVGAHAAVRERVHRRISAFGSIAVLSRAEEQAAYEATYAGEGRARRRRGGPSHALALGAGADLSS